MAKAEIKTKENEASVEDFINQIEDETKRKDCGKLVELMSKATDAKAKMWGTNIIGFGLQHLKYDSGREMDWLEIGFSPRSSSLAIYGLNLEKDLVEKLGKHKMSGSCLHVKKLSDIDLNVLETIIKQSVTKIRSK
jgi:hypothetical protein